MFSANLERARIVDRIDRRVLGALRFADATTNRWISQPLRVTAATATLLQNRSGVYVIRGAATLEPYVDQFAIATTSPQPEPVTVNVRVEDPSGRYLPRMVRVKVPRDADPHHADEDTSLFRAVRVPLYPAPAAPICPGWAVVRVRVTEATSGNGLPHVWLRLRRASLPSNQEPPLGVGMTDSRGEGLVAVSGIPATNWGVDDGPLLATEIDAAIDAYFDPNSGSPPDPDIIDGKRAELASVTTTLKVASGRHCITRLEMPPP